MNRRIPDRGFRRALALANACSGIKKPLILATARVLNAFCDTCQATDVTYKSAVEAALSPSGSAVALPQLQATIRAGISGHTFAHSRLSVAHAICGSGTHRGPRARRQGGALSRGGTFVAGPARVADTRTFDTRSSTAALRGARARNIVTVSATPSSVADTSSIRTFSMAGTRNAQSGGAFEDFTRISQSIGLAETHAVVTADSMSRTFFLGSVGFVAWAS